MITLNEDLTIFISQFEQKLKQIFHEQYDINTLSQSRGLPAEVWTGIMNEQPLSVAVGEEYGGRGLKVNECLRILSAASYESLPLSLTFGINIALFLEPLAKYGSQAVKDRVLPTFVSGHKMGGLMITEPDFGSDALNMRTAYTPNEEGYAIQGTKHWQGLTGQADYWLVTARKNLGNGDLARDIDFFVTDDANPAEHIRVEHLFPNLGLYMIPYGKNILDLQVPSDQKLNPESTGIKMMLDILHRSRMQFPGMGMGFIKRMLDDSIQQCDSRIVGNSNLLGLDAIQQQVSKIQVAYSLCSGMCARSSQISSIANNLATEALEANAMKALVTDLMQESAQIAVQVSGANGYKLTHVAARGIIDSRPFQIFEGSNEMLYTQIAENFLKLMKKKKESHLYTFLQDWNLSSKIAEYFKSIFQFAIPEALPQRKMIDLGKIIARLVCTQYVVDMQEKGYRSDLVDQCLAQVHVDITQLVASLHNTKHTSVIQDYNDNSAWYAYF